MPVETKFMSKANWQDIERQYMFEAIVMFAPERPLGFFVPDSEGSEHGTIVSSVGEFKPGMVQKAVVGLKQRKVLILSPDEHNHEEEMYDVQVAPIYSIHDDEKGSEFHMSLKNDEHPFCAYLDETVTGRECFVDLSEITTIHKNMLLSKKKRIPDHRMEVVEKLLKVCLGLSVARERSNTEEFESA